MERYTQGLKKRELVCIARGGERLPHIEFRADWRGKVH